MQHIQQETGVFLFTTSILTGAVEIEEYYGLVSGQAIQGANFVRDYLASLSDRYGGRARGYENAVEKATEQALREMARQAKALGANAVLGLRINHGDVNNRMLMATCYGTAIRYKHLRNG